MRQGTSLHDQAIARRSLLQAARLGATLGLLGSFPMGRSAQAQTRPAAADDRPIWSGEYWAKKYKEKSEADKGGGTTEVNLNLWRKRIGAPQPGEPALPVLFLVHGSSNSARTSFDLAVPGKGEYSLMNVFARYGYDVWTMDHDGYGHSGSSGNNSDIASSVADLKTALAVLRRETGQSKAHFYGTSSGAIRAAAFAQAQPDAVDRLVLVAFTYKGTGSPTLRDRAEKVELYRASNRRRRDRAMIRSIFTRDGLASSYDMAVAEAMADEELKFGDQVPTGTYLDMTANLPLVDPTRILCPVAMIRGDHDGIATLEDLFDFYRQLPNGDRMLVSLPNTAHSPGYANNRHLLWYATRTFLAAPAPAAS
jgi:pimeloyl-ACP methyl ester carboxylesterase